MEQSIHSVQTDNEVKTDSWTEVKPQYASLDCLPNCPTAVTCDTERTLECPRLKPFGISLVAQGVLGKQYQRRMRR